VPKKKDATAKSNIIELSTPWIDGQHRLLMGEPRNEGFSMDEFVAASFIIERSRVHEQYIRDAGKTKRLGYLLAAALLGLAIVVPVFAPDGRSTLSVLTSATLALFAAGVFGYSKFKVGLLNQKLTAEHSRSAPPKAKAPPGDGAGLSLQ
jgi:hypothetical protein